MITTYKPTENADAAKSETFKITLPPDSCELLYGFATQYGRNGLTVEIRKQTTAENGDLTAILIDNEPTVRIVFYYKGEDNQVTLLDPNKYELKPPYSFHYNPDKEGDDHITLTEADAATRLKIVGVVEHIIASLK